MARRSKKPPKQHPKKFLKKHGLLNRPKRKQKSPYDFPDLSTTSYYPLGNTIPANGTKDCSIDKVKFTEANYAIAPLYNKGPSTVVSKADLNAGAGRKI